MDYIEQAWLPCHNGTLSPLFTMPALVTTTLIQGLFLLAANFFEWSAAVPLRRAEDCPGYKASNVVRSKNGITADLTLAGSACNLYSPDIADLEFTAEWQTGRCPIQDPPARADSRRLSPSCDDLRQR